MLKTNSRNILKINLKLSIILKIYYKNIILKSIFQNHHITNKQRLIAFFFKNKSNFFVYKKKCCLISGRQKGLNPKLNFSRHQINYLTKQGILTNFKINSW